MKESQKHTNRRNVPKRASWEMSDGISGEFCKSGAAENIFERFCNECLGKSLEEFLEKMYGIIGGVSETIH